MTEWALSGQAIVVLFAITPENSLLTCEIFLVSENRMEQPNQELQSNRSTKAKHISTQKDQVCYWSAINFVSFGNRSGIQALNIHPFFHCVSL